MIPSEAGPGDFSKLKAIVMLASKMRLLSFVALLLSTQAERCFVTKTDHVHLRLLADHPNDGGFETTHRDTHEKDGQILIYEHTSQRMSAQDANAQLQGNPFEEFDHCVTAHVMVFDPEYIGLHDHTHDHGQDGSDRRKLMSRQLKHNHDTALESVGGRVFLGVHNNNGEAACEQDRVTSEGKRQVEEHVKRMLSSEPQDIMDHMEISVQVGMTRCSQDPDDLGLEDEGESHLGKAGAPFVLRYTSHPESESAVDFIASLGDVADLDASDVPDGEWRRGDDQSSAFREWRRSYEEEAARLVGNKPTWVTRVRVTGDKRRTERKMLSIPAMEVETRVFEATVDEVQGLFDCARGGTCNLGGTVQRFHSVEPQGGPRCVTGGAVAAKSSALLVMATLAIVLVLL